MASPTREQLVHGLYEAAELEHNLMCTYLYAAFSLRQGTDEGLSAEEAAATARWRKTIIDVAVEEMGHLTAVWNITSALGAAPRFGRINFPLEPGVLPASIVVKLAPFSESVIQHFVHLERPNDSAESEGEGFEPEYKFHRANTADRLVPMAMDYDTVGVFYQTLETRLRTFAEQHGDDGAFCGDPQLQLGPTEIDLVGAQPVICVKTALKALDAIVAQGEGAPGHSEDSHFVKFVQVRTELAALKKANPAFSPAWPSAVNPVLRPPVRQTGRVWIENEEAARTVDVANAGYALMLRLLAYSYALPRGAEKGAVVGLAIDLMRAISLLGERAARLPAGPSNPHCNAGMSFTALRDASPLGVGAAARKFIIERFDELAAGAKGLAQDDDRAARATRMLGDFAARVKKTFANLVTLPRADAVTVAPVAPPAPKPHDDIQRAPNGAPIPTTVDGVDEIPAEHMTLLFDQQKCIHSRHCVTGAPEVFLANVKGPWILPDAVDPDYLAGIAHMCPSGAIRYKRTDGHPDEPVPPVNLVATREDGPYAVRGEIHLDGGPASYYRLTLCRCGGSKNKPFCDSTHKTINFDATGEPSTFDGKTDMLEHRGGALAIDPQTDGPLQIRGNLEITSGTGRVVARIQSAKLCRCGGSNTKPFCDGTHAKIGFRSDR